MNIFSNRAENVKYRHPESERVDRSAEVVVPILLQMVEANSVVDVGCGVGKWLKTFKENGVNDILGVDGPHLDPAGFLPGEDVLIRVDLEKPFRLDRRFDLAVSIEVAEHISPENARGFVESLCLLSDTIVFSAAAPGQGGQNHLNEQPPSYWIEKFESFGFEFEDRIRPLIWDAGQVQTWYKQNMLFFRRSDGTRKNTSPVLIDVMHPDLLKSRMTEVQEGAFGVNFALKSLINAISMRLRRG